MIFSSLNLHCSLHVYVRPPGAVGPWALQAGLVYLQSGVCLSAPGCGYILACRVTPTFLLTLIAIIGKETNQNNKALLTLK